MNGTYIIDYPSLNEMNYLAFGDATEEYHDELYAYIDYQGWENSYMQGKVTRLYHRQLPNRGTKDEIFNRVYSSSNIPSGELPKCKIYPRQIKAVN